MRVTREKTEDCQAFLTVEMEPAEVEESLEEAYHHLAGRAKIPGFRKGKAPREILERYIGKEEILEDAISHLLPQAYKKAVEEQEIEPIAQPHIEITQTDPIIFKAIVPLRPTVEIGGYHSIRVAPEKVEIAEDNVGAVMEELRHQHATWEPVERSVDFGDLVVLDVDSEIEGKSFINQQGVQYQVIRDSVAPAPGFAEQLSGMSKSEEKEFNLEFPADYSRNEVAGKEASFRVKINEIKQEILPELDDELAKQVNPDFKTLESLREQVTDNLKLRAEEKARADFEERVIEAAVDLAHAEFSPVLVETEVEQILDERLRYLQMDGKGLEEYLKSANQTKEQLLEELRPVATKRIIRSLVLGKVAEEEKIEVSEAEIDAETEKMMQGGAEEKKDELQQFLNTERFRDSIKNMLMTRKTMECLVEIAKSTGKAKIGKKEEKK
ncbi:trigger factor [Chloroflexota bacterium]